MKQPVAYIISNIQKSLAFEWIAERLRKEFNLFFILLNPDNSPLEKFLRSRQIEVYRISYAGKKDIPKSILKVREILKKNKVKLVHCHLFDASLVGLLAARSLGIRNRIYTRHHATFHHIYFPRAVYYDRFINFMASDVVAISENVRQVLIKKEGLSEKKIHLIHHGFELSKFSEVLENEVIDLKFKYQSQGKYPVIGVIARQVKWKGIQYILPAFRKLQQKYPNAYLILANAKGDYRPTIQASLQEMAADNYREVDFEENLFAFYQLFDVHVHTPIDAHSEAFGQTYVEALAAGIPSVFTLSGVAPEFIQDQRNALVVPFQDSEAIYQALLHLLDNEPLKNHLIREGKASVASAFSIEKMIRELSQLYKHKING